MVHNVSLRFGEKNILELYSRAFFLAIHLKDKILRLSRSHLDKTALCNLATLLSKAVKWVVIWGGNVEQQIPSTDELDM